MTKMGFTLSVAAAAQLVIAAAPVHAAPVTLLPSSPAPATVQVDAQQIRVNTRRPLPFKPFPMVDWETGQPLSPEAIITLQNGKQMTAGAYFAQLNQLEQQFNALGYSLREPGTVKLEALKMDLQQLHEQEAVLQALPSVEHPPASSAVQTPVAATAVAHTASIPRGIVGVRPVLGYGSQSMSKSWDYSLGNTDTIGAELSGQLNVIGSQQGVSANGAARASGAILGDEWDLARVTGNVNAPQSGPLSAQVELYVAGVGDMPVVNQSTSQSALNASDQVSQPLDVHQDFHFSIGPIPMSARLGLRGSAGVKYAINLQPAKLGMSVEPQVQVDGYGQGGVDVEVASGGIGCDLTLLHDQLQMEAQAGLTTVAGAPALQAHCYGSDNLDALGGHVYAYAKVDLGLWDKEWDWDIWDFAGIQKNFTLFDETQTLPLPQQQLVFKGP